MLSKAWIQCVCSLTLIRCVFAAPSVVQKEIHGKKHYFHKSDDFDALSKIHPTDCATFATPKKFFFNSFYFGISWVVCRKMSSLWSSPVKESRNNVSPVHPGEALLTWLHPRLRHCYRPIFSDPVVSNRSLNIALLLFTSVYVSCNSSQAYWHFYLAADTDVTGSVSAIKNSGTSVFIRTIRFAFQTRRRAQISLMHQDHVSLSKY